MSDDSTHLEADEWRRSRRVWATLVVLGILVAAGALSLGWGIIEGRLNAARQLDEAIALLERTEPTVDSLDEVFSEGGGTAEPARVSAVLTSVDEAQVQLTRARELAEVEIERMTDDEQEHARLVQAAIGARLELLAAARPALVALEHAQVGDGAVGGVVGDATGSVAGDAYRAARQRAASADEELTLR